MTFKRLPSPPETPSFHELQGMLSRLEKHSSPLWGEMNSSQMLNHCRLFIEIYLGKLSVSLPIRIVSRVLGRFFLRRVLKSSPRKAPKNLPTLKILKSDAQEDADFGKLKAGLLKALEEVSELSGILDHQLYGKIHAEDVQSLVRHHTAYHANQFGLLA